MCDYVACKTCVRTYILSVPEPCCMNCRSKWSHEFIKDNLGASFVNHDLKEHQRTVLVERSISRREEILPRAIMYRDDRADKEKIKEIQKRIEGYKQMINECLDEIEEIENRIHVRNGRRPRFRDWRRQDEFELQNAIRATAQDDASASASTRKKFIMPCQKSGCNGMLNQQYNCELCNTSTCSKCLEVKGENHECNPDSVLSATMLKKDTKPCPKCGVRISKIDGCDQMWCVECKTAFSWNTGKIESGKIHNPHYYQFMREHGGMPRDPNDIAPPIRCGNYRDRALDLLFAKRGTPKRRTRYVENRGYVEVTLPAETPTKETIEKIDYIINYIQYANHLNRVTVPDMNRFIEEKNNSQNLEILYILGELSKEDLANKLIANKKCAEKTQVFHDIYTAINMMIDQLSHDIVEGRDINMLYNTIVKYTNYFNAELVKALMLYDSKRTIIVFNNHKDNTHINVQYKNKTDMINDIEKYTKSDEYTKPNEPEENVKIGGGGRA